MPVISAPHEYHEDDLFVDLSPLFEFPLALKCECFNFAGSVKLTPALAMVEAAERGGRLRKGSVLVESSSGNLGVALAVIAASKGYGFVCITDNRCNRSTRQTMEAVGASVQVITEPDPVHGLLGARIDRVRTLCASDSKYVWLNQYENENNWQSHFARTAPAIARQFPDVDVVFIGAGTTGTLMGCARWFARSGRDVRIVAVDTVGSVTFGGPPSVRMIPGLGTGIRPSMLDESLVHDVVMVPEADTVRMCRRLAARGFLFGGSTGTVVKGAARWLADHRPADSLAATPRAVAIAPDLGERYLDTIYTAPWADALLERGADALLERGADALLERGAVPVSPLPVRA